MIKRSIIKGKSSNKIINNKRNPQIPSIKIEKESTIIKKHCCYERKNRMILMHQTTKIVATEQGYLALKKRGKKSLVDAYWEDR